MVSEIDFSSGTNAPVNNKLCEGTHMKFSILVLVTMLFHLSHAQAESHLRFWRGFRQDANTVEEFRHNVSSQLVPRTAKVGGGKGLISYMPVFLGGGDPMKPAYLPDEIAIVHYETEAIYKTLASTPEFSAYGKLHYEPGFFAKKTAAGYSSGSLVTKDFAVSSGFEKAQAFHWGNVHSSWMKDRVYLSVLLPKKGESSSSACFQAVSSSLKSWVDVDDENGAALLYDSRYLLLYQRGQVLGVIPADCQVYEQILLVNGFSFHGDAAGLNLEFAVAKQACEPTVIAVVKVKPGSEERFKELALSILTPTRAESGSLVYRFQQSTTDKTIFTTYERWKNFADLDAHMQMPHMQNFFAAVGALFEPGYPMIHALENIECVR